MDTVEDMVVMVMESKSDWYIYKKSLAVILHENSFLIFSLIYIKLAITSSF